MSVIGIRTPKHSYKRKSTNSIRGSYFSLMYLLVDKNTAQFFY